MTASVETAHLAQAEASAMLIEILMVILIERGILSRQDLIEAVETARDTKRQFVAARVHPEISAVAEGLLSQIGNSLAACRSPGEIKR